MYGHAITLLTQCTRPGCGAYGSALDDDDRRVCAAHALHDLIGASA